MPTSAAKALLTDIGTEELAHLKWLLRLFINLFEGACPDDYGAAGWEGQWVQHDHGLFGLMLMAYLGQQNTSPAWAIRLPI